MLLFFILAASLWGLGILLKAPTGLRWMMIALLYLAALLAATVLPESNGLRQSFGGSLSEWGIVGGFAGLVSLYCMFLRKMRAKAQQNDKHVASAPQDNNVLKSAELERYSRHIMLREIGGMGQRKLKEAKVLVIGAGGLGAPVLQYLAASGVGTIGVVDDDVVEASNLQRQVIHTDAQIGVPKVFSAADAMRAQNSFVTVKPYNRRFDESCSALVEEYDLVVDGCDNFATRYLVNAACVRAGKSLVSGAITQWEGQISTYHPAASETAPCYQCVFPQAPADGLAPSCAEAGVAAPLPGIIGTMLAMEVIKELTGAGQGLKGRLLMYDALDAQTRVIKIKARKDCPICG
jgi:molybdopterin/thiamine biosynthesis adenylyltransferase